MRLLPKKGDPQRYTYADLQERRKIIRKRFEDHRRKEGRRGLLRRGS